MAADLRKTITHPRGGFVKYPLDESEIEAQKETKKKKVQRRRHKAARAGRTAAVVVMVCIFAVGILYGLSIQGKVIVPSVVGEEQSAAQELLTAAGLTVTIGTTYSEEYDAGIVIEQSYNSGQRVDEGTSVTLTVSEGTQWFYMANFVGESEEDAMEALSDSGAKNITFDYVQDSDVEPGIVISQTPDAGYQSKDDAVVITVSGRSVLVPALTGLTLDGATALIEAEGLTVGTVTEGYSADAAANTVIAQNVAPNSEVLAGSEIDLTICRQEDSLYYPASSFTVVVPLENLKVEVTLETPSGEETVVYSQTMDMGTYPIELSSGESGTHTVRVYLEGVLIESTEIEFS